MHAICAFTPCDILGRFGGFMVDVLDLRLNGPSSCPVQVQVKNTK